MNYFSNSLAFNKKNGFQGMPINKYKEKLEAYYKSLGWNSYPNVNWNTKGALNFGTGNNFDKNTGQFKKLYDKTWVKPGTSPDNKMRKVLDRLEKFSSNNKKWLNESDEGKTKVICKV